jgi:penicillin-binding protein 1A
LKGVPQFDQPAPDGIRFIDGEPYYDNFTPENGLVTNVGVTVVDAISNFFGWTPNQAPASPSGGQPMPNAPGTQQPAAPASRAPGEAGKRFQENTYQGH